MDSDMREFSRAIQAVEEIHHGLQRRRMAFDWLDPEERKTVLEYEYRLYIQRTKEC